MHTSCAVSTDFQPQEVGSSGLFATQVNTVERVGRYRLGRLIKRGGMAEVFEAYLEGDSGFVRRYALKRPLVNTELHHLAAFADEARILSQLEHPGIVSVFDFGTHEGWPYQVLELVDGLDLSSLHHRVKSRGESISAVHALRIMADAAEALHYAHSATDFDGRPLGIVHRDVSPHNVVVSWRGEVKVLDFGVALANGRLTLTQAGVVKGKLSFMAPEQLGGERVTPRADVFSLGCVLYAMLTGESPFVDLDRRLALAHGESLALDTEIDPNVRTIVETATAHDPAERYKTARDFAEACTSAMAECADGSSLRGWLSNVAQAPTTAPRKVARRVRSVRPGAVVVVGIDRNEDAKTVAELGQVDLVESGPTSRMSTPIPTCGPYRLVRSSRFGTQFYEAKDPDGRRVGLRMLQVDADGARLFAEAAARRGRSYRHSMNVDTTGSSDGRLYFVTPRITGHDLGEVFADAANRGGLSSTEVAALGVQIIDGVLESRSPTGTLAADVRPESIILTNDGAVMLIEVVVDGQRVVQRAAAARESRAIADTLAMACVYEARLDRILASLAMTDGDLAKVRRQLVQYVRQRSKKSIASTVASLFRRLYSAGSDAPRHVMTIGRVDQERTELDDTSDALRKKLILASAGVVISLAALTLLLLLL